METQNTHRRSTTTLSTPSKGSLMSIMLLASASLWAGISSEEKMLFEPSDYLREAGERGRIMIDDGFENKLVDKALDEQFDRIDNMMFVRVAQVQDNGGTDYESDDCD